MTKQILAPNFNPIGHIYEDNSGNVLDSVTGIIKHGLGLYVHKRISPKAEFGTNCHKALQYYNEKDLDESTLDPAIAPYLAQFKLACIEKNIEPLQSETMRYCDTFMFAGTIDLIAKVDGKMALIDYKTGKVEGWHRWQLAAYGKLLESEIGAVDQYALYLQPDGYNLLKYEVADGFNEFLSLLVVSKLKRQMGINMKYAVYFRGRIVRNYKTGKDAIFPTIEEARGLCAELVMEMPGYYVDKAKTKKVKVKTK